MTHSLKPGRKRSSVQKGFSDSHLVRVGTSLILGEVEYLLGAHFAASLASETVEFDLRQLTFVGHFPATLLFSWCSAIALKGGSISILLPPVEEMAPQVRKALLQCGVLSALKELGAKMEYSFMTPMVTGVPLKVLTDRANLWKWITSACADLSSASRLSQSGLEVVRDALDVVLFELAENAFVHTEGSRPHVQVTISESSGNAEESRGLIAMFPPSTKYVEICLGDLGPGIEARLDHHLPKDYSPPFCPKKPTHAQKVLSYAFEFSSTSDKHARHKRLNDLLGRELDPDEVASGLFCVLEVARSRMGQLLIRTPKAILSIDFSKDRTNPIVAGHKKLGLKGLAELPGTHFLIRMPLELPLEKPSRPTRKSELRAERVSQVSVISAFRGARETDTPAEILHRASSEIDRHFNRFRSEPGLSIFMPAPTSFHARSLAVFLGMLRAVSHGQRTVFWLEPRAKNVVAEARVRNEKPEGRFRFGGQAVLIGDLISNELLVPFGASLEGITGLLPIEGFEDRFAFQPALFKVVQGKYAGQLQVSAAELLNSESVRHEPGPFLIEGKYYRDVFFELPRALDDVGQLHLCANWFFLQVMKVCGPEAPDLLIGTAPLLEAVMECVAEWVGQVTGKKPAVVCREPHASTLWALRNLLSYHGKRAVVLSDIVCRGKSLEEYLMQMGGITIQIVLAFVDARAERNGQPLVVSAEKPYSLPLKAIVSERIKTYYEPPPDRQASSGEERVYVIDAGTRAPTLYVRHTKPQNSILNLLDTTIRQSGCLFCGHIGFGDKHYSYYLDFPRLFAALRKEIEVWVQNQIGVVDIEKQNQGREPWFVRIFNPDASLTWLKQELEILPQRPEVNYVSREEFDAPPPPDTKRHGHWVIVIPALASGETARRAIEFASRFMPHSILLLCVVSRMDPQDFGFMSQIGEYAKAEFRMSVLLDFPAFAYVPGKDSCPACSEIAELRRLHMLLLQSGGNDSRLAQSLIERISSAAVVQLESLRPVEDGRWPLAQTSEGDLARARLLALYQAGRLDLEARKELSATLLREPQQLDWFLELIGRNTSSRIFSPEEIERRIYKSFSALCERARSILASELPPFQLGRVVGGIAHLLPGAVVERAPDLLIKYAGSIRDVEEICFVLVALGKTPANGAAVIEQLNQLKFDGASALLGDTLKFLHNIENPDERDDEEKVREVARLWAKLARSSLFYGEIKKLASIASDSDISLQAVLESGNRVINYWRDEVIEPLKSVREGRLWPVLARNRGDGPLRLEPLESSVSKLGQLSKCSELSIRNPRGFRLEIGSLARIVRVHAEDVHTRLNTFFVNVVECIATKLPSPLLDEKGKPLNVAVDLDRSIGLAFCDLDVLDSVVTELIGNWRKHSVDAQNREAWFKLSKQGTYVVLEFGDKFGGKFNLASWGGVLTAKEFCRKYCVRFQATDPDVEGKKIIKISLRGFPDPE